MVVCFLCKYCKTFWWGIVYIFSCGALRSYFPVTTCSIRKQVIMWLWKVCSQHPMTSRNHQHNIMLQTMILLIPTSSVCFSVLCLALMGISGISSQKYKYWPAFTFKQISSNMFVSFKGNAAEISTGVCVSQHEKAFLPCPHLWCCDDVHKNPAWKDTLCACALLLRHFPKISSKCIFFFFFLKLTSQYSSLIYFMLLSLINSVL